MEGRKKVIIMKKKIFVVIGGLWFDKVNGNTYNVAKIIDVKTGMKYYTDYTYGYGNSYIREADEYIWRYLLDNNGDDLDEIPKIIDGGSFYCKKSDLKNQNF